MPHDPYNPTYVLAPHDDGTWRREILLSQHRRGREWRVTVANQVDGYTFWRGHAGGRVPVNTRGPG